MAWLLAPAPAEPRYILAERRLAKAFCPEPCNHATTITHTHIHSHIQARQEAKKPLSVEGVLPCGGGVQACQALVQAGADPLRRNAKNRRPGELVS